MIYIASRKGRDIVVRSGRNNARPGPGEAVLDDGIARRYSLTLAGVGDSLRAKGNLYRLLDRELPDLDGDLGAVGREAEVLACRIEAAVREAARRLKGQGVWAGRRRLEALLKYEVLNRLDSPRKVREVESLTRN